MFADSYKTIAENASGEFKDRGSSFLGFAFPVRTENDIKELLNSIKKSHPKANHHCYAFRIGTDMNSFRFSDDREPSGSAGKPIYGVIQSLELTNVLIIVVRYFGGSLLGIPGLINAYSHAAKSAIDDAQIIEKPITEIYQLTFGYDILKDVTTLLRISGATVLNQKMEEQCSIAFEIVKSRADELLQKIKTHHLLQGKCKIEVL
jgi:uncharacterized YigZ family protein